MSKAQPLPDNLQDSAEHHIRELRKWLDTHPGQRGTNAYTDRLLSLDRWLTIAEHRKAFVNL